MFLKNNFNLQSNSFLSTHFRVLFNLWNVCICWHSYRNFISNVICTFSQKLVFILVNFKREVFSRTNLYLSLHKTWKNNNKNKMIFKTSTTVAIFLLTFWKLSIICYSGWKSFFYKDKIVSLDFLHHMVDLNSQLCFSSARAAIDNI